MMTEAITQADAVSAATMENAYKSGLGFMQDNNSGIAELHNEQIGYPLDWVGDNKGVGMDIQAIISEFGGFDDFFEDDVLPLGEPPGTMELEDPIFYAEDCGNASSSVNATNVLDQSFLPVGFASSDNSILPLIRGENFLSSNEEVTRGNVQSAPLNHMPSSSTSQVDNMMKLEAMMIYAAEFGAVKIPSMELSSLVVRTPYVPISREIVNQNPSYGATPPSYPCFSKSHRIVGADNYYTYVDSTEESRASVLRMMVQRTHREENDKRNTVECSH